MLIADVFSRNRLKISGVIHIGAHACEESSIYSAHGIPDDRVIWIEGNPDLVKKIKTDHPYFNIYHGLISNSVEEVPFIVTNNFESSSILELETHKIEHPHIHEIERKMLSTTTLTRLFQAHQIGTSGYNFLNLDIQGAELLALKGMGEILDNLEHIYTEVNEKELYKNCALLPELRFFLEDRGFELIEIEMTPYGWGDAYFART